MPRVPRGVIIPKGEPIRLVCISQCVQQLSLCAGTTLWNDVRVDRRQKLVELVDQYLQAFAIQMHAMAFLANEWITVLQLCPHWARQWSNEQVLVRAAIGLPGLLAQFCRKHQVDWKGNGPPPAVLLEDQSAIETFRDKLQNLSLFEQLIKQRSAAHFNREARRRGAFWSEPFFSFPISEQQESVLVGVIAECLPQVRLMVQCLEQCSTGSGWDRLVEYVRQAGLSPDGGVERYAVWLNEDWASKLGVPPGLRTEEQLLQEQVERTAAWLERLAGNQDGILPTELERLHRQGTTGVEGQRTLIVPDAMRSSQAVEEGRAVLDGPTTGDRSHGVSPQGASLFGDPERVEELVRTLWSEQCVRKPLALAPMDCRPYRAEDSCFNQVRGVGPVTLQEWVGLLRWVSASWCGWRLANAKDKLPVPNLRPKKKPLETWVEELLQSPELSQGECRGVFEKLEAWLTGWGRISGLPSLSSVERVRHCVERLFERRRSIEGISQEVGRILGLGPGGLEALRGVLGRVDLTLRAVIGLGEACNGDLVSTLREVTRFNQRVRRPWMARRRAAEAAGGQVVGDQESPGHSRDSPDTS